MTESSRQQWEKEGTRRLVAAVIKSGVVEWHKWCEVRRLGKTINKHSIECASHEFKKLIRFFETDCNNLLPPGMDGKAFLRELYKVPGAPKPPGERE